MFNNFSINCFDEYGFYLRSQCGLYESQLEIYRRVSPAADFVRVDSKE